jgi:hypothetical protein
MVYLPREVFMVSTSIAARRINADCWASKGVLVRVHRWIHVSTALALFGTFICAATASESGLTCHGNLETGNRQIIQAGVTYKLSYEISGVKAKVRFAGREFDALAETGKSWKGIWIKRMGESIYFSFLPSDGGTIKFQFEPDRWYSGNCLPPDAHPYSQGDAPR